jgi:hypothetical protein
VNFAFRSYSEAAASATGHMEDPGGRHPESTGHVQWQALVKALVWKKVRRLILASGRLIRSPTGIKLRRLFLNGPAPLFVPHKAKTNEASGAKFCIDADK